MSNLPSETISIPTIETDSKGRIKYLLSLVKNRIVKFLSPNIRANIRYHVRLIALIPPALTELRLMYNYAHDFGRFLKMSSVKGNFNTQTQLSAVITMDYHRIEKGLALQEPRIGFGADVVQRLLSNLWKYHEQYGIDVTGQIAINTLFSYYNFNLKNGLNNDPLYQELLGLKAVSLMPISTYQGGVIEVTKKQIREASQVNFLNFANSRFSIRHFAPIDVDMDLIEKAIVIAQKTPSVCNRQSSKVHVFSSYEDKKKVLTCQNGNRGFGDQASKVLVVTSDLQHFVSIGERNQPWIDGGMFAMSLVYALHSLGLGTCCLNWSVQEEVDTKLRRVAKIKDSESVIMMIAVGHLPDELKVAQSPRKTLNEVMVVH